MKIPMIAAFALSLIAIAGTARPQQPSFATPNGAVLRPYENAWLMTVRGADGVVHPQGIWSDHVQYHDVGERHLLMRVQGMTYINGRSSTTINVFDPATMLPVSSVEHGADGKTLSRDFAGAHVSATRVDAPGAAPVTSEADLPAAPYDYFGGMWGLLLATMPLRPGFDGAFPSIDEFADAPAQASYHVVGREMVQAGSHGRVQAWRVRADQPGNYRMTFWLLQSPPYVIALEYVDEHSARVTRWDMI